MQCVYFNSGFGHFYHHWQDLTCHFTSEPDSEVKRMQFEYIVINYIWVQSISLYQLKVKSLPVPQRQSLFVGYPPFCTHTNQLNIDSNNIVTSVILGWEMG